MAKTKMIAKICPACKGQVPVACKSCPCGHFFYNARRIAREFAIEADYLRRTARVRREKPNYYDALEYDKHIKKDRHTIKKIKSTKTTKGSLSKLKKRGSESRNEDDEDEAELNDKKEAKLKRKKQKKIEEEDEDDPMGKLTPEMAKHCSMILDSLNSKIQIVMWKPKD